MGLNGFEMTNTQNIPPATFQKYFTLPEANATLPLVKGIVGDIIEQYQLVMEHHNKLQEDNLSKNERGRAEAGRSQATDKLSRLSDELADIGCELKDWECGLVDFPARLDGRDVSLCWKLGEDRITQWHEIHAGFTGREPVTEDDHFAA